MHPDLARHLHTPQCNALIEALQRCHVEHPVKMYMGYCNDMERAMTKCLKRERIDKRRQNMIKAKEMKEKISNNQKTSTFVAPTE
ncbi:COX assembly mitochondrial protein 2 homolog [Babylonia areolata]|uniref:COX assembly mitochondrial protein 2 homolog n=1 Tax=Babylonia areolata TaxID=304850 RepID=UPI003FD091E6